MSAPEGWDDDIPDEMTEAARNVRKMFLALMASGFTTNEAALIRAHIVTAQSGASS